MKRFFSKNWFLIGVVLALIAGFLIPDLGVALNRGSVASNILIVLLFLISGLKLPSESIRSGLKRVKLHALIQGFIFLVIPAYFFLTARLFSNALDGTLLVGFYALACLPTTISSCIIFTQSGEGNVVATMFNAAFANVAGVFISPLLLSLLMQSSGAGLPAAELLGILRSLTLKMLLPILIGQLGRRFVHDWVGRHKKRLSAASNIFILFILFFAFAKTASNPEFVGQLDELALPFAYLAISHIVLLGLAWTGARIFGFDRADRVSVLFTAPQKTLAMGVPLLTTFFGSQASVLGGALLPLVFYHPWQLLVAGVVLRLLARQPRETRT